MWKVFIFLSCTVHSILSWEISKITTPDVTFSHSPYWDACTNSLYFVNFFTTGMQPAIFRYSYEDEIFYSAYIKGITSPSFIIPTNKKCTKCNKCNNELFAIGVGTDVVIIKWNGKSTEAKIVNFLFSVVEAPFRFDTGVADHFGRFYGGTLSQNFCNSTVPRSFYRYTKDKGVVRLFGDVQSSTGIVFNDDEQKMYHLDSCQLLLSEFDYDPKTGDICNGRVIYTFPSFESPPHSRFPIGLAMDQFGFLYIAIYTGEVWKIDKKRGVVVDKVILPQRGVAGIVFGGKDLDILYAIIESSILDAATSMVVEEIRNGTSIYAITGLAAASPESNRLNIK